MGRVASTLRPTASVPTDGGLLQDPSTDIWADWGLLAVPDPERQQNRRQTPQSFRDFIVAAYPGYAFHTWAERLIGLLQRVADGELNRLIVCCPPRLGKSLLVSKLFPAYWVSRYPHRFCAIASYSAELAYAHSREARHYYRSVGLPSPGARPRWATGSPPSGVAASPPGCAGHSPVRVMRWGSLMTPTRDQRMPTRRRSARS